MKMISIKRLEKLSLSRKFVGILLSSVLLIAVVNMAALWVFYSFFMQLYLGEKIAQREDITLEYVNSIIERQTRDDIDTIFSDVELEFFELLDLNDGKIPLKKDENVNIVVDFLLKSGVSPKYIEEVIPQDSLSKAIDLLNSPESPESHFVNRLFGALIGVNIIILAAFSVGVYYLTRKIIFPIKRATRQIQDLDFGKSIPLIQYNKPDEIGLLIDAINDLNKKLSVQEMIRSRLLADISHELKTPITAIQCYLEGISDGVIELSGSNLDSIIAEMTRLTDLVNQIMEFEKFENTELSPDKKSINPSDILSQISETQSALLDENGQSIEITGSKNIEIMADEDLFRQMVYNLIANYMKYAGADTTLTVEVSSKKIVFQDNGVGIEKREIPFVFEKFYQGKSEKTGNIASRGIGVGLSIVKKILDAHGWGSKITSHTGKGFRFEVVFT